MNAILPLKERTSYRFYVDLEDMGTYSSFCRGNSMETAEQNALWDINKAREKDNLPRISLEQFHLHCQYGDIIFKEVINC